MKNKMKEYLTKRINELEEYHHKNKFQDESEDYRINSLIIELENALEFLNNLENNKNI